MAAVALAALAADFETGRSWPVKGRLQNKTPSGFVMLCPATSKSETARKFDVHSCKVGIQVCDTGRCASSSIEDVSAPTSLREPRLLPEKRRVHGALLAHGRSCMQAKRQLVGLRNASVEAQNHHMA